MRFTPLLLLLCLFLCFRLQAQPVPRSPSNGEITYVNPFLFLTSIGNYKYFCYQVDTSPSFNSPIRFQSPWVVTSAITLNYDSMLFNQGYHWRVRSVRKVGANYDTSGWSTSETFFTGTRPKINGSKNVTFYGPSGEMDPTLIATFYREYEVDTSLAFNSPLNQKDTVAATYDIRVRNLRFGKKYYFRYRDFTSLSMSSYSDTGTITVGAIGASFLYPTNSSSYAPKTFVIIQANADLSLFECEVDVSLQFNTPQYRKYIFSRSGNNSAFSGDDLYLGTMYRMRVRAITHQDTSAWSQPVSVTTADIPSLFRPFHNSTAVPATEPLQVFSFNRVFTQIQLDTVPDFSSPFLRDSSVYYQDSISENSNTVSVLLTDYKFNRKYYYRARIYNSVDTSNWRGPNTFITGSPNTFFTFPYNNQQHLDNEVQVSWNSVQGGKGYHIQLSTDSFNSTALDKYVFGQNSFFTSLTLLSNTVYDARIRIFTSNDTTAWLDVVRFRTHMPLVEKVSPADSAGVLNDSIPFKWKRQDPRYKYIIAVWAAPNLDNQMLSDTTSDTLYYFHPPQRGKMYYWQVKSIDSNYVLPTWYYNYDWAFMPMLAAPQLTTPVLGAINQQLTGLVLKWDPIPNVLGYEVQVDVSFAFSNPVSFEVPVNNAVLNTLPANTRVYWRIRAYNDFYGAFSDPFWFTTKDDSNTGIGEFSFARQNQFVFYPNPFNDVVEISIPQDLQTSDAILSLYNIKGQLIKDVKISGSQYRLQTSDLPEGLLMYKVQSRNGVQCGKLLKTKQ